MSDVPLSSSDLFKVSIFLIRTLSAIDADPRTTREQQHIISLMGPQDIVDVLCMLGGRKPVYLIRGFGTDHPQWREAIMRVAIATKLHIRMGSDFRAEDPYADAPRVIRENSEVALSYSRDDREWAYVAKDKPTDDQLAEIFERNGRLGVEQEAALLGYPVCCVRERYERNRAMAKIITAVMMRMTGGDAQAIRDFGRVNEPLRFEGDEEERLATAMHVADVAPFTPVIMCRHCASTEGSPARLLGDETKSFIASIDPFLVNLVEIAYENAQKHLKDTSDEP